MPRHLLDYHVLLIQNTNIQATTPLLLLVYQHQNFWENFCIRSTAHRRAMSCHLFECYVLLIQNTKFQPAIPFRSRHIADSILFEKPMYQEHHPSASDDVPPFRVLCFPDTKYEISACNSFWFTRYCGFEIFRKTYVSGAPPIGGRCRATSSTIMFSWYKVRNFNLLFLFVHEILRFQNFSKNLCIRSTAHRCRATSSSFMFFWYKIRILTFIFHLFHRIF